MNEYRIFKQGQLMTGREFYNECAEFGDAVMIKSYIEGSISRGALDWDDMIENILYFQIQWEFGALNNAARVIKLASAMEALKDIFKAIEYFRDESIYSVEAQYQILYTTHVGLQEATIFAGSRHSAIKKLPPFDSIKAVNIV